MITLHKHYNEDKEYFTVIKTIVFLGIKFKYQLNHQGSMFNHVITKPTWLLERFNKNYDINNITKGKWVYIRNENNIIKQQ